MTSAAIALLVLAVLAAFLHGWLRFRRQRDSVRKWLDNHTRTAPKQRLDDDF